MFASKNPISLTKALIPIFFLISLLTYNAIFFKNKDWFGENTYHIILFLGAFLSIIIGLTNNISFSFIKKKIFSSIKSIAIPIVILLLVGALAGTWKISGIIPSMVYYGLNLFNPSIFLPLTYVFI